MELGLEGAVVLVTGGSKGIGLACASAFLAEGARVAIASRREENLARALEPLQAEAQGRRGAEVFAFQADLTRPEAAAALVEQVEARLGPITVLINSAGAARRKGLDDLTAADWQAAMEAKFLPYIHAMDAVLPRMAGRRKGAVVNIIGMGGKVASTTHLTGGAANAALMLASTGLAAGYAGRGVRINAINPGSTVTERLEQALALEAAAQGITRDEALARKAAAVPMRRFATPEEVADVALFLASGRAAYVTGAIIPMDGGANPLI